MTVVRHMNVLLDGHSPVKGWFYHNVPGFYLRSLACNRVLRHRALIRSAMTPGVNKLTVHGDAFGSRIQIVNDSNCSSH